MSPIDKKSLYIFDLDSKIKESLELLYFDSLTQESVQVDPLSPSELTDVNLQKHSTEVVTPKANTDNDPEYYKSDLFRFNLKRSLNQLPPLTEVEFESLLESQSIDSLSGSESESEEDTKEANEDQHNTELKLQALIKKMSLANQTDETEDQKTVSYLNTKSPFILFKSSLLPLEKAFGLYKSILNEEELLSGPLEALKGMSSLKGGKSALFMIGGGHFAGAIVSHTPKNTRGNSANTKESLAEQSVHMIASKTFHRYTTRRKQGGSQSASDNARGKANSAGSSIRRYNEQALIKEVRELLEAWKSQLDECTAIFIRANGSSNKKTLVGYEGSVLKTDDQRIRTYPFTTKRATASELRRAWVELTHLKAIDLPKVNTKAIKKLEGSHTNGSKNSPAPEEVRDPKEIENDNLTNELIALMKKQKAPKLLSYLKSNNIDVNKFKLSPELKYANTPTLLHFASANDLTHMIQILINNVKADPTVLNIFERTPVELTSDSSTKKSFQVSRFKLGEDFCDWAASKVGPPKSKEEFEEEDKLESEKVKLEKQNMIQEELSKKTEMELRKPKVSSHGTVGGTPVGASMNDLTGLSEEQKMRLIREQRARAAEARFKKTSM